MRIQARGRSYAALTAVVALGIVMLAAPRARAHSGSFVDDSWQAVELTEMGAMGSSTPAREHLPPKVLRSGVTPITILNVSDFHGSLEPNTHPAFSFKTLGGAAYLDTYFDHIAATSPAKPFLVTAGDAVGATQAISGVLGDKPTIDVMNMMGFDADTLGNHNFDSGEAHMKDLARAAKFPYVVANLENPGGEVPPWIERSTVWDVGGVKIGVTGAINEDATDLLKPDRMGNLRITDASDEINEVAAKLRSQGVKTVVALVHVGATRSRAGEGPLFDLAKELKGVDVLIGDHTNWQVNQRVADADGKRMLVVENFSNGISFSDIRLVIDNATGETVTSSATSVLAVHDAVQPDPEIAAYIAKIKERTRPILSEVVGKSSVPITRTVGWSESNQGNLVTDAMRADTGVQFAFENSGGLRTDLTREDDKNGASYVIRLGHILDMLPFSNRLVTLEVTGADLKQILEHSVSSAPAPEARFLQVSGLEFEYSLGRAPGSRVTEVCLPDPATVGCSPPSDTLVDLTASARYTIAMNDFLVMGGDGYPRFTTFEWGELLDQAVADYIRAETLASGGVAPPGPVNPNPAAPPPTRIFVQP